jgi:CBS domain-containing membrane protein
MYSVSAFMPRRVAVPWPERLRGALGGGIGIAFAAFASFALSNALHLSLWLAAPVGASAVLVFAVPASPLAQPWSVVGGNTVTAVMGLLACNLIPDPVLAASVAVSLAIAAMFALRCLHPPGGAMALLVVLTHTKAPVFALFPAFTNSLLLVAAGLAYHAFVTRHSYPHVQPVPPLPRSGLMRITQADFAAALAEQGEVFDIDPEDLGRLLQISELKAYRRMAGALTCADVMSRPVHTVHFGTPLGEAWTMMNRYDVNALPVVDRRRRPHGLLTRDDFIAYAALLDPADPEAGLVRLLERTREAHSDKPEVAGQIMSETYTTARVDARLEGLLPLFSEGDRHHVVVLDAERRVCGIVATSDTVKALYHAAAA